MRYNRQHKLEVSGLIKIFIGIITLFIVIGCAPKSLHYWGSYDQCLYAHYLSNDDEKSYEALKAIIVEADKDNLRLAPGLNAEYGFMLYLHKEPSLAVTYFKKEAQLYPESTVLMNALISRLEKKEINTDEKSSEQGSSTTIRVESSGGGQ